MSIKTLQNSQHSELRTRAIISTILLIMANVMYAQNVLSPSAYGWKEAKNGIERYKVLYRLQADAVKTGATVDYSEIDTANIELGYGCPLIPLADYNDFKGMVINVTNTAQYDYIFRHEAKTYSVNVSKEKIDNGDFSDIEALRNGDCLLSITDQNVWGVRNGYSDHVIRKDLIYIRHGKAITQTILPYNNEWSSPECSYIPVAKDPLEIKNLTVNRTKGDAFKTCIFDIKGVYDVRIFNVTINTPDAGDFYGDQAIRITDCMDVLMEDVTINGSYSQKMQWGYGIYLGNVANFTARRLYGHAAWGIFGNVNVNTALLEDCDINRWDIHHYGKDITLRNCTVSNVYNQYSSVYGTVTYDGCTFNNCIPHLIDHSYNAYTKYVVQFINCTINTESIYSRLFLFNRNDKLTNTRHELEKKYWPDVKIKNMRVNIKGKNAITLFIKRRAYYNDNKIDASLYDMLLQ